MHHLWFSEYSYERLDGSVRGEERFLAVQNFNKNSDTFVFLLSTKAGGQGLNLVAADTVIFVDSDFNPQNDLQAAARAHRIGQTRSDIKIFTFNQIPISPPNIYLKKWKLLFHKERPRILQYMCQKIMIDSIYME